MFLRVQITLNVLLKIYAWNPLTLIPEKLESFHEHPKGKHLLGII